MKIGKIAVVNPLFSLLNFLDRNGKKRKIDYISKKRNNMEFLGKALYLLLLIVFMRFFYFILRKSFEDKNSTTVKIATRSIVLFFYTIAILTLFAYAIFATEMGANKRVIAGLIAIFMTIYFGIIIKKYIKKEAY